MNTEDLKRHFKTTNITKIAAELNTTRQSVHNWVKWGFIPEETQFNIQGKTNCQLKVDKKFTKKLVK